MGICQTQYYNQLANKSSNAFLKNVLEDKLKDLIIYNFTSKLREFIPKIQPKYLYSSQIVDDIRKMLDAAETNKSIKCSQAMTDSMKQKIRQSYLIIEDEVFQNRYTKTYNINYDQPEMSPNTKLSLRNTEHERNLYQNQSLVCQINLIYKCEFDHIKYNKALKLFLRWSSKFMQHFTLGFLQPIYEEFNNSMHQLDINDFDLIVQEIVAFVHYLVDVYTEIYHLKTINESQRGSLFKKQNVFNLVMATIFLKTSIKTIVRRAIKIKQQQKIKQFQSKLQKLKGQNIEVFKVQPKFMLRSEVLSMINQSNGSFKVGEDEKQNVRVDQPYGLCLKAMEDLSGNSETPITKLKLIVQISKAISSSIYKYYEQLKRKDIPELDPENLICIIMYLIVRVGKVELLEELKIAEYFTTTNCLNCISGYYLNTFNAAIETLLTF